MGSNSSTKYAGTVIRSTGSWYHVQTVDEVVRAQVRGKFRLNKEDVTNPIAVGDRVSLQINKDGTGYITDIHERESKLTRRAAGRRVGKEHVIVANVDQAWAVQATHLPRYNTGFIDRFLVMAEVYELDAGIIFNKMDLSEKVDHSDLDEVIDLYRELGYPVYRTSALTDEGIDALREAMTSAINVITGPSGVGKTALLNKIEPGLDLKTGEVSDKTHKGKHTTTFASLHPLSGGGFIADTPGLREFGVIHLEPTQLAHYFREFHPHLNYCRFPNCTHDHEPGCAVKDAVDEGDITKRRYESYLNILDGLHEGEQNVGR